MKKPLMLAAACWVLISTFEACAQAKGEIGFFGGYSRYYIERSDGNHDSNCN
jgi:hypothetical protein